LNALAPVLTFAIVSLPSSQYNASQETARASIKAARVERKLEFNKETWIKQKKEAATIIYEELRLTGSIWTNNCVKCFVDTLPFDHPKGSCGAYTGELTKQYRGKRMGNNIGTPLCYHCAMPMLLCQRWLDEKTGRIRTKPEQIDCTYNRPILDTWACLWEYCPKAKMIWLQRIQDESEGILDGEKEEDFARYFRTMIHVGSEKPIGRIALDVNWFTHRYFKGNDERWKELLEC
jgi:hypothetical protein